MAARPPAVACVADASTAPLPPARIPSRHGRCVMADERASSAASSADADPPLARHTLVWLRADADWQCLAPGADGRLRAWFAEGHPAIVARRDGGVADGLLRLGVPLPPAEHKQRIGLLVARTQLQRQAPPPTLEAVIAHAPANWQAALSALLQDAHELGIAPRVFGSFAWQALTGLAYVHADSDLDLLWPAATPEQADAVVGRVRRWEQRHALRVDGELLLPDAGAVNWREYAAGERQVLVKGEHACRMLQRAALFPGGRAA
jgi:phosphoribosyl-dephospho-CoA transferase